MIIDQLSKFDLPPQTTIEVSSNNHQSFDVLRLHFDPSRLRYIKPNNTSTTNSSYFFWILTFWVWLFNSLYISSIWIYWITQPTSTPVHNIDSNYNNYFKLYMNRNTIFEFQITSFDFVFVSFDLWEFTEQLRLSFFGCNLKSANQPNTILEHFDIHMICINSSMNHHT